MPDYREHGWQRPPHSSIDEECLRSPQPPRPGHVTHASSWQAGCDPSHPSGNLAERAERLVQLVSRWSGPVLLSLAFLGLGWLVTRA